jgi:hypothetical protein
VQKLGLKSRINKPGPQNKNGSLCVWETVTENSTTINMLFHRGGNSQRFYLGKN